MHPCRFLSPDPLWEKYTGLSPYQYSFNNPIAVKDFNGKDGVNIIDNDNKTMTITAVYVYNTDNYANNPIIEVNDYLNKQNYSVSEGLYKGYQVRFDLQGVPDVPEFNHMNSPDNYCYNDINIGNKIDQENENYSYDRGRKNFKVDPFTGDQTGGITSGEKYITMNKVHDNLRNRIHEIFHTLFFHKDNAKYGIGSYERNDMPTQEDINLLIYNNNLPDIIIP